jgi:hypothetical protein
MKIVQTAELRDAYPDPHNFAKPDPDLDPYHSEKLDPDPHQR